MTLITSPTSEASSCSRQFAPLVLYPKMNHSHQLDTNHSPKDTKTEKQVNHHLARINEMLERNAKWWADQEHFTHAILSEESICTSSHKKGFERVEIPTANDNDNDYIDMLPSTSTSSTSSNSSADTNDSISTTIITTPTNKMSMSTLVITPSIIAPLEPKTDIPPPPLYHHSGRPSASASMTTTSTIDHSAYYRRRHRHSTAGIYYNPSPNSASPPPLLFQSTVKPTTSTPPSPSSISSFSSTSSKLNTYSPSTAINTSVPGQIMEEEEDSYGQPYYHDGKTIDPGLKKRRRGNLPKHVTEFLRCWLLQHKKHPYPTERQKVELAQRTGLAVSQISNWFINARRRILQPMLETELILARQQQPMYHTAPCYYPSMEEKKRRQLDIYAYHGFTETTQDDTQRWSIRRTKLPNIEIPEKDRYIFATDP